MRFHSTPESADRLEPTWLAIIETVAAAGALFGIITYFHDVRVLIVPAVFSPLLLLETPRVSVRCIALYIWTLRKTFNFILTIFVTIAIIGFIIVALLDIINEIYFFDHYFYLLFKNSPIFYVAILVFFLFMSVSWFTMMIIPRILITAFSALSEPIYTMKYIARNFSRIVLCTDLFHPPEILRGSENARSLVRRYIQPSEYEILGMKTVISKNINFNIIKFVKYIIRLDISDKKMYALFFLLRTGQVLVIMSLPIIILLYIFPPFLYRFSLKSSAVFWIPIIWIASQVRESGSAQLRIARIRRQPLQQVVRVWSGVVLLLFSAKIWLWFRWSTLQNAWNSYFSDDFMLRLTNQLVWPDGLPLWHIAAASNALLSLGLWMWVCGLQIDLDHGGSISERRVNLSVNIANSVRSAVTCYVLVCTVYIVVSTQLETKFPIPDIIVAPWSERGELPNSRP